MFPALLEEKVKTMVPSIETKIMKQLEASVVHVQIDTRSPTTEILETAFDFGPG